MNDARLEHEALNEALQAVENWVVTEDETAIARDFKFADFREAFAFMSECALAAERLDHHPDWSNSYNRVGVSLSTHDAGGVSTRDIALAGIMDEAARRFGL
ncbi:4a-hydroxytetrahydrobiopterin dehydratase [Martelella endophytica]|uniref:Putative pterin-4-alpha-carbinolamine dehydratase n=1 Tax=Martelella endophytica TaxID=1486262 RepID=A0A0D5LNM5_MAREN|nr:4a-hydroxytetrahydrobiopterin dehydratase [Martelella endophytica]AJY44893.1 pterin-4-alpha-carbinolamine dehydratase [Martelella endophytica]